jgi:hypothetical protein
VIIEALQILKEFDICGVRIYIAQIKQGHQDRESNNLSFETRLNVRANSLASEGLLNAAIKYTAFLH